MGFIKDWVIQTDTRNRMLIKSGRFKIAILLLTILALLLLNLFAAISPAPFFIVKSSLIPWSAAIAAFLVCILSYLVWRELLEPLLKLSEWADLMRGVNLDSTVELRPDSDFIELGNDINMLGRMISQLSLKTEEQLQKHTEYISRESRSLAILYEVAWSINESRDLEELFQKSLESLCLNLNAKAGLIRQIMDSNELEVIATSGKFNQSFIAEVNDLLPQRTSSGISNAEINSCIHDSLLSSFVLDATEPNEPVSITAISVPMLYRDQTSGIINLFFSANQNSDLDDYDELLISIGQHLGTAVEKFRLDDEESRLLIMHERARLSHELHDSLAQTIASLRIQIRILDEMFQAGDTASTEHQISRMEYTLAEANNQLRELIEYFHVPMNKRGLISSVKETITRVKEETGMHIYLQNEWLDEELPASIELHVLRIIQECIANIRKHSQAKTIRVLLRGDRTGGQHYVLIEDDGIGFDQSQTKTIGGEHLGLNILRDRANQINGEICIDSDPGEGTRVDLKFIYPDKTPDSRYLL